MFVKSNLSLSYIEGMAEEWPLDLFVTLKSKLFKSVKTNLDKNVHTYSP